MKEDDVDILARTIYGEARGEGQEGMEAVACVVMNRYKDHKWYTGYVLQDQRKIADIAQTCLKRFQFSCWNKNDPNYWAVRTVDKSNPIFRQCLAIAERAVAGELADCTNGAVYYHTKQIKPRWALYKYPCCEIKNHLFYRED